MHCLEDKELEELIEVSINLSKSLDNVAKYEVDSRILQWQEKYEVKKYQNKAKKFLTIPSIKKMYGEINKIYKDNFL